MRVYEKKEKFTVFFNPERTLRKSEKRLLVFSYKNEIRGFQIAAYNKKKNSD